MKQLCRNKEKRTAVFVILSLVFAILTAAAVFCIHKFLSENQEGYDEEDEDYIDENGVCYTDEKNFVD